VERDQVLGDLTRAFLAVLDRWTRDGLAALRQEYAARAHGLGERIAIRMSEALEDTVGGIHRGVDEQGRLLVELDDGTIRTIAAGDVFLGVAGPDSARSEGRE
jgi:BirA family biotin operon repressor/biotin-[acetyl-CoA-carboxylase] ligase